MKSQDEIKIKEFEDHLILLKKAATSFKFPTYKPPYFISLYLEEYDDYAFFAFTEEENPQHPECFFIDWLIYSQNNEDFAIKKQGGPRMDVTKCRFNLDFGLDFSILNHDEKNFFFQAYAKIITLRKLENEDQPVSYSAVVGEFTVELTLHKVTGNTYKQPLKYRLISNQKQPIAVTVSLFNEYLVKMVGAVLAINPHSVSRQDPDIEDKNVGVETGPGTLPFI